MENEIKILKFIRDHDELTREEILIKLDSIFEKDGRIFQHLLNQGFISLIRKRGRIGQLKLNIDPLGITTNGIKHLETRIPKFIKSYVPVFISCIALFISIIAILK